MSQTTKPATLKCHFTLVFFDIRQLHIFAQLKFSISVAEESIYKLYIASMCFMLQKIFLKDHSVKFLCLFTSLQWKKNIIRKPQQNPISTTIASNIFLKWLHSKCYICCAVFYFLYSVYELCVKKNLVYPGEKKNWEENNPREC